MRSLAAKAETTLRAAAAGTQTSVRTVPTGRPPSGPVVTNNQPPAARFAGVGHPLLVGACQGGGVGEGMGSEADHEKLGQRSRPNVTSASREKVDLRVS